MDVAPLNVAFGYSYYNTNELRLLQDMPMTQLLVDARSSKDEKQEAALRYVLCFGSLPSSFAVKDEHARLYDDVSVHSVWMLHSLAA